MRGVEKIRGLKTGIQVGSDAIVESAGGTFFNFMQKLSAEAYRETKTYIKDLATTPTGIRRGSPRGRYDTGAMYDAFIGTLGGGTTAGGKYKFRFELGWLNGQPGYTLFQEYGTAGGVKGMEALERGREELQWAQENYLSGDLKAFQRDAAAMMRAAIIRGGKGGKGKIMSSKNVPRVYRKEYRGDV